jgi:hypothetical protein
VIDPGGPACQTLNPWVFIFYLWSAARTFDPCIATIFFSNLITMDKLASCITKEPFIKLGEGTAPVLNYNLPQETCFNVYGRIPFLVPQKYFKPNTAKVPKYNFWDQFKLKKSTEIRTDLLQMIQNKATLGGLNLGVLQNRIDISTATLKSTGTVKTTRSAKAAAAPLTSAVTTDSTKLSLDYLSEQISKGYAAVPYKAFNGEYQLYFVDEPVKPAPQLFIVETYTVCSYLGDYGAGKTLNVMSLLPGEKTEISIKTYLDKETTNTASQSILDSFSESSADEFEQQLKEETAQTDTTTKNTGFSLDLSGTLSLTVPTDAGEVGASSTGAAGYKHDKTNTTTSNVDSIDQTITKHVQNSSKSREVQVNVTSSETVKSGEETSIVRQLENINRSRVLNFVFRQLLQEYVTLVSLTNVRVVYTNGYPESTVVMNIYELEDKLKDIIVEDKVQEVKNKIIKEFCTVYNYAGEPKAFLEKVVQDYKDCECLSLSEKKSFCRINRSLKDEAEGFTVNGVILSVKKHILPTPAVIVDSLLGQGEALDCYNMQLQQAAVDSAHLNNRKLSKAFDILDGINDAAQKASAYDQMLGECCETGSEE